MQAVLLDALGTLVELEPPWERLAGEPERVRSAFKAEMAYYREHAIEARDSESLADLRARCAALLSERLGREVEVPEMMDAIRFRAFDDAEPALSDLRGRGLRLVVVSNWDYALPRVLERVGLLPLLDGVVTSASVGAAKPDPAIFRAALEVADCEASEALHVGDSNEEDVAGAGAAGIRALLLDRSGAGDLASLAELPSALGDSSVL
jgi:putative hydrolase of the HAD superfamily